MPDSKGNTVKSLLSSSPEENLPMATMKSVQTGNQNKVDVVDIERPVPGPKDALVRIRACGICGTDVSFLHMGGIPFGPGGSMISLPLGHEPAGEIVELGSEVTGLEVGDRVVVNPQAAPSGIIGCGGKLGGMRQYLLVEDAVVGESVAVFPDTVPFDVAALNEPMAVARHCVNRSEAKPTDKVVVFGAGPIGLGATIWLKLRGVEHVTVADVIPERLETALAVGADAVINSATEDVTARLTELHGPAANALGQPPAGTDIYLDAAGAPRRLRRHHRLRQMGRQDGDGRRPEEVRQHRSRRHAPQRAHPHRLPGLPHGDLRSHPRDRGTPGPVRQAH